MGVGAEMSPSFSSDVTEYTAGLRNVAGIVVLSVGPTDMGQRLQVSFKMAKPSPSEVPLSLASMQYRRRNFTLGSFVNGEELKLTGGDLLQLPVHVRVHVWPATERGNEKQLSNPHMTYSVMLTNTSAQRSGVSGQ